MAMPKKKPQALIPNYGELIRNNYVDFIFVNGTIISLKKNGLSHQKNEYEINMNSGILLSAEIGLVELAVNNKCKGNANNGYRNIHHIYRSFIRTKVRL